MQKKKVHKRKTKSKKGDSTTMHSVCKVRNKNFDLVLHFIMPKFVNGIVNVFHQSMQPEDIKINYFIKKYILLKKILLEA